MAQAIETPIRKSSRRRRKEGRGPAVPKQKPFAQPRLRVKPVALLSDDQIEAIHDASMRALEEIGVEILLPEACELLEKAGAIRDGERVRIGREIIDETVKTAPEQFTVHARNPAHNLVLGGDYITFSPSGGPPNCADMDDGRRPGSLADSVKFIKLAQHFNAIHISGAGAVDALDVHAAIRHLEVGRQKLFLSDKLPFAPATSRERFFDCIEMARISRAVSPEQLLDEPSCFTVVNINSPLKIDGPMAMGLVEGARLGQAVCVTPFTLAGAMAPVTVAGAIAQQNAEALAGIAINQLARPGAPVIYGAFTSNVDMKSGAPAFGTPEYVKAAMISGQLTRRYGIPYRTSGSSAANAVDAQAAYETVFALWGAVMGGGHLILHAAGWMEGGLVSSLEKFVLDVDLLQMITEFLEPMEMSRDALGLEAMREVGPGGHFFGAAQTMARYQNAFYQPMISDWRNFEQWQAAGAPEAKDKANQLWKQALDEFEPPPLADDIRAELNDFVDRRISEGGSPTDF